MTLEAMRRDAATAAKNANDPHFTVEEIALVLGGDADEFLACMAAVDAIISDPGSFLGVRAALTAAQLAGWRTKIGMKAQMYKTAAVGSGPSDLRKRKDILMTLYEALIENINTLKLLGKAGPE